MTHLARRNWVPAGCEDYVLRLAEEAAGASAEAVEARVEALMAWNSEIHDRECFNLNPATNVMNPRAEAALARGLGSRPSLGYPGDKYEMGLEAIEKIEVIAAELAAEVIGFKGAFRYDRSKPDGTPRKLMNVSRLTQLGWRASTSLEDGIRLAYQDFLKRYA